MSTPEEIAREIAPCSCGLDEFLVKAGTGDPKKHRQFGHGPACAARLREKIAAALAASEQRKCHNCNDEPATQCAKCLHAAEDALHTSEQRARELEKECAIEAKQFVDMKSYADCVEIKLQASERALKRVKRYAAHKPHCEVYSATPLPGGGAKAPGDCTCGLTAALASPGSPKE